MAEPEEVLLKSLRSFGIRLPSEVSSIGDLETAVLISICAQSLNLIADTASFPTSFPDLSSSSSSSDADQVKVCTEMASAIKSLGYLADISFHQFLYPSEEESCELIRFLVERISGSSEIGANENGKSFSDGREDGFESYLEDWIEKDDGVEVDDKFQRIETKLNRFRLTSEVSGSVKNSSEGVSDFEASNNEESVAQRDDGTFLTPEKIVTPLKDGSSMTSYASKKPELECLEEELSLLKTAVELAFDDQHSVDSHLEQLKEKVDVKSHRLQELNARWEALRMPLEEEKKNLQNSLYANRPESEERFQKLKEIEVETRTILSEIDKRKDELSRLSQELEKQPKAASRKSYIDRVKEITKNSRKQDADIERILKDTRELQLESNTIQERLHRTYAVVDEMVFREAKKDPVGRQAYRLLTSIHECFEQISEKILATDRVQREVAEREKKLAAMASRSLNVDKLQTDLDAIRRENEHLEKGPEEKEEKVNPL